MRWPEPSSAATATTAVLTPATASFAKPACDAGWRPSGAAAAAAAAAAVASAA